MSSQDDDLSDLELELVSAGATTSINSGGAQQL